MPDFHLSQIHYGQPEKYTLNWVHVFMFIHKQKIDAQLYMFFFYRQKILGYIQYYAGFNGYHDDVVSFFVNWCRVAFSNG